MYARVLHTPDLPVLDAFLRKHADSSMILRSNLLANGIEDSGARFAGVYAGAFEADGALRAVAAHYRFRGNVFPQAECEEALDLAVACAVEASRMPVRGVLGRRALVRRSIARLALEGARRSYDEDEDLFALELAELRTPALLFDPGVQLRALQPSDAPFYLDWLLDYDVNSLGDVDNEDLRARHRDLFDQRLATGEPCLLTHGDIPRAMTAFNATLPDMVQVGGVYTPPAQRSRGYARAAVALSLLHARSRGVKRAMLFTGTDNLAARAAYRALGFTQVGDFAIVLFR